MVSRHDHAIKNDRGPDDDPTAGGQADQPSASSADLVQPLAHARSGPRTPQQDPERFDAIADSLRRTGAEISDLRNSVLLNPVDTSSLSEDVVGHAGLARALQDFIEYWHNELGVYAVHLDDTGQQLGHVASRYRATDEDATTTLSALDSDSSRAAEEARDPAW